MAAWPSKKSEDYTQKILNNGNLFYVPQYLQDCIEDSLDLSEFQKAFDEIPVACTSGENSLKREVTSDEKLETDTDSDLNSDDKKKRRYVGLLA